MHTHLRSRGLRTALRLSAALALGTSPLWADARYAKDDVLSDEFNGALLDTTRWSNVSLRTDFSTHEPANATVLALAEFGANARGLRLSGVAQTGRADGNLFTSARVVGSSSGGGGYQAGSYGYYEVRLIPSQTPGWRTEVRLGDFLSVVCNGEEPGKVTLALVHTQPVPGAPNDVAAGPVAAGKNRFSSIALSPRKVDVPHPACGNPLCVPGPDDPITVGIEWTPDEVVFYGGRPLSAPAPDTRSALTELARIPYGGPHTHGGLQLVLIVGPIYGSPTGVAAPAAARIDYVRYWRREYNLARRATAPAVAPVLAPAGAWFTSRLAYGPEAMNPAVATKKTVAMTYQAGAEASWPAPTGYVGAAEVYVWNPAVFSPFRYLGEIPADTAASLTYQVVHRDGTTTARTIDAIAGAQLWTPLGVFPFTGTAGQGVNVVSPAVTVVPTRVSSAYFQRFDLVFEDFAAGAPAGWSSAGTSAGTTWQVANGRLQPSAGHTGVARLVSPPLGAADAQVRALLVPGGASSAGIIGRAVDVNHHYLLRIDYPFRKLGLLKLVSGTYVTLANVDLPDDVDLAAPATLHLSMDGGVLTGAVNHRHLLRVVDPSPLGAGGVGVRVFGGGCAFDDLGSGL